MAKSKKPSLFRDALEAAHAVAGAVTVSVSALSHPIVNEGEPHHPDVRFEKSDVNAKGVVLTGACLLVGIWVASGLLYFYFAFLMHHRENVSPPALPVAKLRPAAPPEPRLQATPREELRQYEASQDYLLTHYLWVDKAKGIVAIPIERAIEITAQRGIPPQKTPAGMTLSKPEEGTRVTGFEGKVEPEPR